MVKVKVIAPLGATVRAPVKLRLSPEQLASRAHLVGKPDGKKICALKDGALNFKLGEEFEIEDFDGRLNPALFEVVEKPAAKKAAKANDATADASVDASNQATDKESADAAAGSA